MITTLVYLVVCVSIAAVLSTVLVMVRPVHERGESRPWKTFLWVLSLVALAPYIYHEGLTRLFGKQMEVAIREAYEEEPFQGPIRYYRLTSVHKESATAYVVGTDTTDWGGQDTPVIMVDLAKDESGNWKAKSYKVMASGKLNQEHVVLPPYW